VKVLKPFETTQPRMSTYIVICLIISKTDLLYVVDYYHPQLQTQRPLPTSS